MSTPKPLANNQESVVEYGLRRSVPVAARTAHKMFFEHGQVKAGQVVLVYGAAENVGAYTVQLAQRD